MGFDLPIQSNIKKKIKEPIVPTTVPRATPFSVYGSEQERADHLAAGEARIGEAGQSVRGIFSSLGRSQNPLLPQSLGGSLFDDAASARQFGGGLFDIAASFVPEVSAASFREGIQSFMRQGLTPGGSPDITTVGLETGDPFGALRGRSDKTTEQVAAQQPFQRPFPEMLGEHITSPWYVRYPLEVVADPWNLAGGAIAHPVRGVKSIVQAVRPLRGVSKIQPPTVLTSPGTEATEILSQTISRGKDPDEFPNMIGNTVIDVTSPNTSQLRSVKLDEVFGTGHIEIGLSRTQEISSALKGTWIKAGLPDLPNWFNFRMTPENKYSTPAMEFMSRAETRIENVAEATARDVMGALSPHFEFDDKGRILDLAGLDDLLLEDPTATKELAQMIGGQKTPARFTPGTLITDEKLLDIEVPSAPTLQDLAARLPIYRSYLSEKQIAAMEEVRKYMARFEEVALDVGMDVGNRADVMDGGFYIHRGGAVKDGPRRYLVKKESPFRGKSAYAKAERFDSMAQSIQGVVDEDGILSTYSYPGLRQAIKSYVTDFGHDAVQKHVANYFKSLVDPTTGKPFARQASELMPTTLQKRVHGLRKKLSSTRDILRKDMARTMVLRQAGTQIGKLTRSQVAEAERLSTQAGVEITRTEDNLIAAGWEAYGDLLSGSDLKETRDAFNASIREATAIAIRIHDDAKELKLANRLLSKSDIKAVEAVEELRKLTSETENYLNSNLFAEQSRLSPTEYFSAVNRIADMDSRVDSLIDTSEQLSQKVDDLMGRGVINAEDAEDVRRLQIESRKHSRSLMSRDSRVGKWNRELKVLQQYQKRLDGLVYRTQKRADDAGKKITAEQEALANKVFNGKRLVLEVTSELDELSSAWHNALDISKSPTDASRIDIPGVYGYYFPDALANGANAYLSESRVGEMAGPVVAAFNTMYRGFRSTGENSHIMIQGLLAMATNPRVWAKAMELSYRAWGASPGPRGERAIDMFVRDFTVSRTEAGRLGASQWGALGLRISGADTEFKLGQGITQSFGRLPLIRNANRAFGAAGDATRLEWADDVLESLLRKNTLEELRSTGELERVAKAVNRATGWTERRSFGTLGDLVLFAPRFLQARMENVGKSILAFQDPRIIGEAIPFLPVEATRAPIDQRIAAKSMLRMIGFGTTLTIGANYMQGRETDFRPVVKGPGGTWIKNSNFMRFHAFGRDVSVFGAYDSLLGLMITSAYIPLRYGEGGGPHEAVRSMASGSVANLWDFLSGSDAIGNRVRDNPTQVTKRVIENFTPFAWGNAGEIRDEFLRDSMEYGIPAAVGRAAFGTGLEFHGARSSPLSKSEQYTEAGFREATRMYNLGLFQLDANGNNRSDAYLGRIEDALNMRTSDGWYALPPDIRREVEKNTKVKELKDSRDAQRRARQSPLQVYIDDREVQHKKHNDNVKDLAAMNGWTPDDPTQGAGKEFRDSLAIHKHEHADAMQDLRDANADMLDKLHDYEKDPADESYAYNEYTKLIFDPKLENEITKEYDYAKRKKREADLREKYGDGMIDRIETYLRDPENEHPLETLLRQDREILEPYWEVEERIVNSLPPHVQALWNRYREADKRTQHMLRVIHGEDIRIVEGMINDYRTVMRQSRPDTIGVALQRWGYSTSPQSPAEMQEFLQQVQ